MGMLRVLLALAVVTAHAGPIFGLTFTGGLAAVETFFIISGFYMALILDRKYTGKHAFSLFISNRFLRLFPIYWTILFLSIAVYIISRYALGGDGLAYLSSYSLLGFKQLVFMILANLFIFGQDTAMFLGISSTGHFFWTSNFALSAPTASSFLLIPQAWTLELEMLFYLMAPWLVKKSNLFLGALISASIALRLYIYLGLGLTNDPWTYRFFPTELCLFLLGIIAYRIYRHLEEKNISRGKYVCIFIAFMALTALFQFSPAGKATYPMYYLIAFLAIPPIFLFTKRNKFDRYIGELSYPIYISHYLITYLLKPVVGNWGLERFGGAIIAAVTIVFCMMLMRFIGNPLESYRQRRAERFAA